MIVDAFSSQTSLTLVLSVLCAVLGGGVLALGWDRHRARDRLARLDHDFELLNDQIWELRSAAEARNRAEAASEAKSRFLATVSHEIRTPLNGIVGLADLLRETALTREQQSYIAAIKTSGAALTSLIDEILDFARIESGRLDLVPEPVRLDDMIEGVVELLSPQAQDKGLEIAAFIDPALPATVMADPIRLRQVLINLAGNAVKFTEQGGVGVRVEQAEGGAFRFSVSDSGPGVPEERQQAIFEEFEQADGSTTRRHGGTGLGLAIARRIIDRMGGALDLTPREEGGSIFSFRVQLPGVPDAERTEEPPVAPAGKWALVVASQTFQPAFLAESLTGLGFKAVRAASCDEGLAQLHQGETTFDLMFVDCGLGEQEARMLAREGRHAGIRRILLLFSPYERRTFGEHVRGGFDAWLVKPVRQRSLADRIRDLAPAPEPARTSQSAPAEHFPKRPRVLVAEDNPINALIARASLERLGANVTHAANGTAALEAAEAALAPGGPAFDLILMDVCMPGLDGLDVTRRIRASEARLGVPSTRIVAMTAHALERTLSDCRQAGMNDVLVKPVDTSEFGRLLAGGEPLARSA